MKKLEKEAQKVAETILSQPLDEISGHMGIEPSRPAKKLIRELEDQFSVEARQLFVSEIQKNLRARELIVYIQLLGYY